MKRTHRAGRTLLHLLGTPFRGVDVPLFVSEGTSKQKMRAIRGSDYLGHAYTTLADSDGDLVVFGQSFGASDAHLVAAVNRTPRRRLAYGVHAATNAEANAGLCACGGAVLPGPRALLRVGYASARGMTQAAAARPRR